jgi:FixJ family two-component response regulator
VLTTEQIACQVVHTAQDFLAAYDATQPGCVLLDVQLPMMSGPELQRHLNKIGAVIPVIFVTAHANIPMCVEALREGAFGFLEKPVSNDPLLKTVRAALAADAETRKQLLAQEAIAQRFRSLTQREHQVMVRLLAGGSNKMLATDLNLSLRTIELHRARIMGKMGTRSLAQLARMAMNAGFDAGAQS